MKKSLILLAGIFILTACKQKDARFCSCLDEAKIYNDVAHKYSSTDSDQITEKELVELVALRNSKDSICQPYEMLGAEELIKLREGCGIKSDLE